MKTYKTFSFSEQENPKICRLIFRAYLLIANKKWNKNESYRNCVYDDYGIIDTLKGRFTEHHSSEIAYEYSVKFLGLKFTENGKMLHELPVQSSR